MNHFIRVEEAWSYNLFGGLSEDTDCPLDQKVMDGVYHALCCYIKLKHNFLRTNNREVHQERLSEFHTMFAKPDHVRFCTFYFDNLYFILGAIFNGIGVIDRIELGITERGDLEAMLVRTI